VNFDTFTNSSEQMKDRIMKSDSDKLYLRCAQKKIKFSVVCEVGVYLPETSNVLKFIKEGVKALLVEPDKKSLSKIHEAFKNDNVDIVPYAIYDHNGELELVQRDASTFAKDLPSSPALDNDNYTIKKQDTFKVKCKVFNDVDPGTIELLSIDTEGCEWYVIKNLVSRPKVICLETHGRFYTNPFLNEIQQWMKANKYCAWYKTKSDTIYYKKEVLSLSLGERISLFVMKIYLELRKLKKLFIRK
jgi:FkbM family methyltransferase